MADEVVTPIDLNQLSDEELNTFIDSLLANTSISRLADNISTTYNILGKKLQGYEELLRENAKKKKKIEKHEELIKQGKSGTLSDREIVDYETEIQKNRETINLFNNGLDFAQNSEEMYEQSLIELFSIFMFQSHQLLEEIYKVMNITMKLIYVYNGPNLTAEVYDISFALKDFQAWQKLFKAAEGTSSLAMRLNGIRAIRKNSTNNKFKKDNENQAYLQRLGAAYNISVARGEYSRKFIHKDSIMLILWYLSGWEKQEVTNKGILHEMYMNFRSNPNMGLFASNYSEDLVNDFMTGSAGGTSKTALYEVDSRSGMFAGDVTDPDNNSIQYAVKGANASLMSHKQIIQFIKAFWQKDRDTIKRQLLDKGHEINTKAAKDYNKLIEKNLEDIEKNLTFSKQYLSFNL